VKWSHRWDARAGAIVLALDSGVDAQRNRKGVRQGTGRGAPGRRTRLAKLQAVLHERLVALAAIADEMAAYHKTGLLG